MPPPICNDQGPPGNTPCRQPATTVLHLFDDRYLACTPHAEATRNGEYGADVAMYPMAYDADRNLATWTEGDQPHTATVIALPDGSTTLRLVSPEAELRCLTCGTIEFKVRATGTAWIKVDAIELAKLVTVPLSIEIDTEDGTVTAVKVLDQRGDPSAGFHCANGHRADEDLATALLALTEQTDWPDWTVG